ncbi:cbb3-type cytochrome c oxidase subunit 3 [Parasulfuritortus cantonensis]|uniref:Cbb3-type cytochrome c oxidase subunit 3 n=1 Tax=Parasulfuritortus cantonensis TaxID=2528202 RepID=A0A4R1BLC8_9PROT|nr:cbb3-type cytochrome c oxidase subunit 3 [Parasulfuritortus cantonensis]TCJ18159.1 cbb3-type cytochrome c oxidase subunit 3 [Parasulfuritortus cantonensis]
MLAWLARPENAKPIGLIIFFVTFCLIVWWVYAGDKKRAARMEEPKNIPFLDDDLDQETKDKSNG